MSAFTAAAKALAERLAASRAELEAANALVSKRIALEQAATGRIADVAPESVRLYHGSPHRFETFDFESNMGRGEGAQAFGPGGYMTGHEPLARQYAESLTDRLLRKIAPPPDRTHTPMRRAVKADPQAAAEYLRALQVRKLVDRGINEGRLNTDLKVMEQLPPHLTGMFEPNTKVERYSGITSKFGVQPMYAMNAENRLTGLNDYMNVLDKHGVNVMALKPRIGKGGESPDEVVRIGRELRGMMKGAVPHDDIRPRIMQGLYPANKDEMNWAWRHQNMKGQNLPGLEKIGVNLNSTFRAATGRPGKATYHPSMSSTVNLRNPNPIDDYVPPPLLKRRLYQTDLQVPMREMLAYDYPLKDQNPALVSRIAELADKYGIIDSIGPEMPVQNVLNRLTDQMGAQGMKTVDKMRALKEAGIPGHYFLRGGRRRDMPDQINPSDFNFVIFDQDVLGTPDITEYKRGGLAQIRKQ